MKLLISVALILLLAACKKEDKRQYSEWFMGNVGYSSNNVVVDEGHARTDLLCKDDNNYWGITFYLGTLASPYPRAGSYQVTNSLIQNPGYAGIGIHSNGKLYNCAVDLDAELTAKLVNGKMEYHLPPTKFKNYSDSTEMVMVSGTFRDP
jgi:hypothetical protein